MEKKRIFYLDFIRAISMIIIVNYHFFAENNLENNVHIRVLSDGIWGVIGVAMFFMISGASLMYQYREKFETKNYFKKRFLGIYPMFWIAYSLVFLYIFYMCKGFFTDLPIYKLGISILGMDGYLSVYTRTFYLIGEWFIGCIILIYLLFPLFRIGMKKYPKTFLVLATIINLMVIFLTHFKIPLTQNLIVCSYSFLLGMYFIEYYKNFKLKYVIASVILFVILWNVPAYTIISVTLVGNLMGYALFIVLSYIGEKITNGVFQNVIHVFSKYSYAIFLMHHFVIMKVQGNFANATLDKYGYLCVYLISWVLIGVCSKIVYELNKKVIALTKSN